jgi:C4-dicarboxylate transporter DctM subunit
LTFDLLLGFSGLGILIILLLLRVPVGIALGLVSFVGTYIMLGGTVAWGMLSGTPYSFASSWTLSSIPMFLLMGYVCYHSGITDGLFELAISLFGRLPGGLGMATVGGAAGFSAITGSSLACAAAMGRIAIPEMLKRKYDPALATGLVAAAGTIGSMIPPSILFIVFGIFAEVSIAHLFIAGVMPGLLTAGLYCAVIYVIAVRQPHRAPRALDTHVDWPRVGAALRNIWPALALVVGVFGGMFIGVFSATEAGAIGAAISLIIAAILRKLNKENLFSAVQETLLSTAAIFLIAIGAALFSRFMALSGVPDYISGHLIQSGASQIEIFFGISVMYLIFGMFLDPLGIMLLTLPVLLPIIEAAGMNMVWTGVLIAKLLEMGLITPPVGMNVFVIKGVVGDQVSTEQIFRGVMPFLISDVVCLALIYTFPAIALWLPSLI